MPRPPFPRTLRQFQSDFATEEACQRYLEICRWPDGFRCPQCGHQRAYDLVRQRRRQCAKCRHQVSLTSGTILHRTKIPLMAWFWAAYLMTTDKRGISALLLQRQLGLPSYETAWMMLHKLRRAMVNLTRERLRGEIEVDDTWIGGEQAGLRGSRQLKDRRAALVLVAVEKRGKASGRARMAVISDFKAATILSFITRNIEPGATVYTDGLKSFAGITEAGYKHIARTQPLRSELRKGAKSAVPLADRAIGNLQQWLIGTYHGVSKTQLQAYLDEFVFRHNRRKTPAAAFQTLLGLGTARPSTGYEQIRGGKDLNRNILGSAETTR
ncbi:MAG: IS1595 family transposase [Acidobacteriota bacterium]